MSGLTLDLGIQLQDVFTLISTFFSEFWLLIAFGLGLMAFPRVIRAVRGSIGGTR